MSDELSFFEVVDELEFDRINYNKISISNREILIVKVGNDEYPATLGEIKKVKNFLSKTFSILDEPPLLIVTHHALDFSKISMEELLNN